MFTMYFERGFDDCKRHFIMYIRILFETLYKILFETLYNVGEKIERDCSYCTDCNAVHTVTMLPGQAASAA